MTVQNLDTLDAKNGETMQNISDKATNDAQSAKNGHISFSVASLLADTRPSKSVSPNSSTIPSSSPTHHSSDDEYDSNQEDSIVDVEDLNAESKTEDSPSKESDYLSQRDTRERDFSKDSLLSQGPIRPTPFSALAAAVYQAAHPNWSHQGLVNPFGGPGPMFQGAAPFGVPNMNSGRAVSHTIPQYNSRYNFEYGSKWLLKSKALTQEELEEIVHAYEAGKSDQDVPLNNTESECLNEDEDEELGESEYSTLLAEPKVSEDETEDS
ncbi:unnamed protein product [Diabrotica balteata]|uniref:Uncharacterized protein n=1 Tax=Diabrotica balteata TaxID=107213 RepID=A0A9N9T0J0_DIABA|nr:unnamed protein product [Diabrotica balteata]